MQLDSSYNSYLKEKVLSSAETKELIKQSREGNGKALGKIVEGNRGLVVTHAKRYLGNGVEFDDLIQEGCIGLMKAVERFDLDRETAFGTYASEWILQYIRRSIEDKSGLIRLPSHRHQLKMKAMRTKAELSVKLGRPATNEEIAEELNIKPNLIYELVRAASDFKSLDQINTNNQNEEVGNLLDILEDESSIEGFHRAELSDIRELIEQTIKPLSARQQYIFKARYGFYGEPKTLRTISEELGITFERVRQIQAQVMRKIKSNKLAMKKLRGCM